MPGYAVDRRSALAVLEGMRARRLVRRIVRSCRPMDTSAAPVFAAVPQMGLISISDGTGIGFGQRLTHSTASSIDGSSQNQ